MGQQHSLTTIAEEVRANLGPIEHEFVPRVFVLNDSKCSDISFKNAFRNSDQVASISSNETNVNITEGDYDSDDGSPIQTRMFQEIDRHLRRTENAQDRAHWYFVYHPSDEWYDDFAGYYRRNTTNTDYDGQRVRQMYTSLCVFGDQIDTVILFMVEARRLIMAREAEWKKDKKKKRQPLPVRLHLLIPTCCRFVLEDAIRFPDSLGDFVVEAPGRGLVLLCLPEAQRTFTRGVACYMGDQEHRELGTPQ